MMRYCLGVAVSWYVYTLRYVLLDHSGQCNVCCECQCMFTCVGDARVFTLAMWYVTRYYFSVWG